jgi:DNA excision repair protein ERCC-2
MKNERYTIGVHDLIDTVLRSGSIDSAFFSKTRAVEGTHLHQKIQLSAAADYRAEVPLSYVFVDKKRHIELQINGKADGIFSGIEGITIDEIKILFLDMYKVEKGSFPNHWNQAKCYAFFYAYKEKLSEINVQLTYYFPEKNKTKRFSEVFTKESLEAFLFPLLESYIDRLCFQQEWNRKRNLSIREMNFPFPSYHKGQKDFIDKVFESIRDRKMLFAQAPTGTGKTLASVFPAVKALADGYGEKIFYLTSKTSTQSIAEKTFDLLRENHLRCKVVSITAKDKTCFKETALCEPFYCEFANGHFDRVDEAIASLRHEEKINRSLIEETARSFQVCPFELSLDIALLADIVICDYNYAFDPRVFLKRFFLTKGEYIFLVDEAHNLVDRARDMFSAEIDTATLSDLANTLQAIDLELYSSLSTIYETLLKKQNHLKEIESSVIVENDLPSGLVSEMQKFLKIAEKWLEYHYRSPFSKAVIDFYFLANAFVKTSEFYDERYKTYSEETGTFKVKLFCLDPSALLFDFLQKGRAAVFFSATLLPIDYFIRLFVGNNKADKLIVSSPFPKENLCLLLETSISTKYNHRVSSLGRVVETIEKLVRSKNANFLIFFPSYKYLQLSMKQFVSRNPDIDILVQKPKMSEAEREAFIGAFSRKRNKPMAAFAVMGGIFGEGIDLIGEKLCGALIVGVGFPQVCPEREIIREYFTENMGTGFEYAYIYPGMIKVMQAAGRVIRSPEDRGVVILLDERFKHKIYKDLFPPEWSHAKHISPTTLENALKRFWNGF